MDGVFTAAAIETSLDEYQGLVDAAVGELNARDVLARIHALDFTVWKPVPEEISNRLGWLTIAERMEETVGEMVALRHTLQASGYTDVLLLGMGGSSLAPELFSLTFGHDHAGLALSVLDSTDAAAVRHYAATLDPRTTLYIVATKSGGTVETLSFFKYFYNETVAAVGAADAGSHFVAITDPGSSLVTLAETYGFRHTFSNDPDIGGRYSALSYFGLLPAALVGVDVPRLLAGAQSVADDAAALLGAVIGELAKAGRDKLTLVTSPALASFGDWVEQLVAESLGKDGTGVLPVVGEPLGPPAVYGADRLFVQLTLGDDAADSAALRRLNEAGHPLVRIALADRYDLGAQMVLWELATAVAGARMGVQPFDQPNVEAAKISAKKMVAAYMETGALPAGDAQPYSRQALDAFLAQAQPGDYIALQAYVQPTAAAAAALAALRSALRDETRLATTVGFGPRFLHSTGQLHKGDGGRGLFVQFTASLGPDAPIPDKAGAAASTMGFNTLKLAQALGDGEALRQAGRRLIRFHLTTATEQALGA